MIELTNALPSSWCWVEMQEVAEVVTGNTPATLIPANYGGEIPFVKPPQLTDAGLWSTPETLTNSGADAARVLPSGAVLVSCIGNLGKTAIARVPCATNQQINALVFKAGVCPEYGWYYAQTLQPWLASVASATTVSIVNKGKFSTAPFPLAPEKEQIRIVEKLEELLSELDAGVAELKAAQRKLARYRQSLLKAAMEGTLTADWRATRAASGEPQETGAELLLRLLSERRSRWEQKQLAKFAEQGKAPPKDWKEKYEEPEAPAMIHAVELPEGWAWATVEQLSLEQKYGSSAKTNGDSAGIPVLRMGNIQDGEIDLSALKYLPRDHKEFPDLHLADGDLLFNRTNSPELVGKTAVFRSQITPCSYASYLIGVKLTPCCSPELISAFINSAYGRQWVKSVVTQQVGQANVNGSKLAALAVPLPPVTEQAEITRILVEHRAAAFEQERIIGLGLKQGAAQRKNILKAAFSGQLVPQNPNDEPASALLQRIRAAPAGGGATTARKRGRKTKETA